MSVLILELTQVHLPHKVSHGKLSGCSTHSIQCSSSSSSNNNNNNSLNICRKTSWGFTFQAIQKEGMSPLTLGVIPNFRKMLGSNQRLQSDAPSFKGGISSHKLET
uniref:Uncharacterized protein n=1 Tax=Nelumbo nucifera TaxID=4432 RepID=A0A822ZMD9_NELNU|nr:TPA_asm: hypothetical protein HUJ06_003880 [Nelumbo nucifera]